MALSVPTSMGPSLASGAPTELLYELICTLPFCVGNRFEPKNVTVIGLLETLHFGSSSRCASRASVQCYAANGDDALADHIRLSRSCCLFESEMTAKRYLRSAREDVDRKPMTFQVESDGHGLRPPQSTKVEVDRTIILKSA